MKRTASRNLFGRFLSKTQQKSKNGIGRIQKRQKIYIAETQAYMHYKPRQKRKRYMAGNENLTNLKYIRTPRKNGGGI